MSIGSPLSVLWIKVKHAIIAGPGEPPVTRQSSEAVLAELSEILQQRPAGHHRHRHAHSTAVM